MRVRDISLKTFKTALIMSDELTKKFMSYIRDEDISDIERYLYFFDSRQAVYKIAGPKDSFLEVNRDTYDKYKAFECIKRSVERFGKQHEMMMVRIVGKTLDKHNALPNLNMLYIAYYKRHIEPYIKHMADVKKAVENCRFDEIEGDIEIFKCHIGEWRYNPENHQCYKPCTD